MGYEISLNLAWDELRETECSLQMHHTAPADNYEVKVEKEQSCWNPPELPQRQMESVLILHYLIGLLKHGLSSHGRVDIL